MRQPWGGMSDDAVGCLQELRAVELSWLKTLASAPLPALPQGKKGGVKDLSQAKVSSRMIE